MSTPGYCESVNDSFGRWDPLKVAPRPNEQFSQKIITLDEVRNLVKSAISAHAEVLDYYLRPYSEEKLGILASHQSLVVVVGRPGIAETEVRNFFVKAMPYDAPDQLAYIEEKGAFRKEVGFFKKVVPILMENFKGEDWVPRPYLVKDNVIVFEDMKYQGFSNKSKFLDLESVKSAVACIARYHAASMLAIKRLGEPLNKIFPEVFEEAEYKRTTSCLAWFTTAINLAVSVAEELGLDASSMRRVSHRVYDLVESNQKKHNVGSHGDLWSNNLLFDGRNHCRLVDFQLIRYAPLAHDVMQLIYLTMTRELRGRCEREVIDHYYGKLTDCLTENGFGDEVPDFQELLRDAEEQRLWAVLAAVINFPTIMGDMVTCQEYFFRDRKPIVDKIMARDPEYERRIKDVVREFADVCTRYEC